MQSESILINENLTAFRRRLVKKATDEKNDGLLLRVWTIDGKVFVKTSPDGNPIKISQTLLITFDSMLTYCWYETLSMGGGSQKGFKSSGFFSKVFSLPGRNVFFFKCLRPQWFLCQLGLAVFICFLLFLLVITLV